jgi:hypothetical protein
MSSDAENNKPITEETLLTSKSLVITVILLSVKKVSKSIVVNFTIQGMGHIVAPLSSWEALGGE